ncbi:HD domain-containing protein [Fluviicola taffensis]|uniref:HD domain-containing protein n=1 Tax=Fluviicola taffensis TaxID=191579 RepID=UPI0031380665
MRTNTHRNNKKKIINDPVYGFISIPDEFIFDLVEHPFFQRLRRIKQLGMTHLVYPGALHTRFHHAIGAMHLMSQAIAVIRRKGHEITEEEERAVMVAILLHDIGHGPFSHALEYDIVKNVSHEQISFYFIQALKRDFPENSDDLERALMIFANKYHKTFLYQLVSSQLDMDRLDYLTRDSFFTGVSEGIVGTERIIEMLNVHNDQLVIDEKGIYSIEKFLVARRVMYWQVYLHKTVVSGEFMLINILRRAKKLIREGQDLFGSPALLFFMGRDIQKVDFETNPEILKTFAELDDYDIMGAVKVWQNHSDKVLSILSTSLVNRNLHKVEIAKEPFSPDRILMEKELVRTQYQLNDEEIEYFVYSELLSNNAYSQVKQTINLLMKDGQTIDVSKASDNLNISALAQPVEKYCLCYPVTRH